MDIRKGKFVEIWKKKNYKHYEKKNWNELSNDCGSCGPTFTYQRNIIAYLIMLTKLFIKHFLSPGKVQITGVTQMWTWYKSYFSGFTVF